MSVIKRGNKYWVSFRCNRQRIRKSSPDNSCAGAKAYELLLRQRLARGEPIEKKAEAKIILFKDFADIWIRDYVMVRNKPTEVEAKKRILKIHLTPFFGKIPMNEITKQKIEQYLPQMVALGKTNKTINNQLGILRKLLATAREWEFIEKFPEIRPLKVMPNKTDFLTVDECDKLIQCADGVWRDMILFAIKTGMRFGEIAGLKWEDVEFSRSQIVVRRSIVKDIPQESTKSNKIRYIPFGEEMGGMLLRRKEYAYGDYVFSFEDGAFLRRERCRRKLLKICAEGGVRRTYWHLLRHTFASHLSEKGVPLIFTQTLLGHSDIKTTMRYAHLGPQVTREAIRVLERPKISDSGHNMATVSEIEKESEKTQQVFVAKHTQKQSLRSV